MREEGVEGKMREKKRGVKRENEEEERGGKKVEADCRGQKREEKARETRT